MKSCVTIPDDNNWGEIEFFIYDDGDVGFVWLSSDDRQEYFMSAKQLISIAEFYNKHKKREKNG